MVVETERTQLNMEQFSGIKGVGSIILNSDNQVLVGTETEDKAVHKRKAGMVSIPLETIKPFERKNKQGLLLAGLAEVVTDDNIREVEDALQEVGIIEDPVEVDSENDISVAVAVYHWTGDPTINPFRQAQTDLADLRWMNTSELLSAKELRPYVETIIDHAAERGYLNGKIASPIPVLRHFTPSRHSVARETYEDVSR